MTALLLLTGCVQPLSVQTQYLTVNRLASTHVNTPDPRLLHPDNGQQLVIQWWLPRSFLDYDDLHVEITVRLKDREEIKESIKLCHVQGYHLFPVINETYTKSGGISTYKVLIVGGGKVLESWYHPLWVELIHFE